MNLPTTSFTENFADLYQETLLATDIRPGMKMRGIVIDIDQNRVTLSCGLKSHVLIPTEEFEGEEVALDDEVDVIVESLEDGFGSARASREKARRNEAWDALEKAYRENKLVTGLVTERVKGGYTISLNSVRGFLPGSLVDNKGGRDSPALEGKELEFKIIKIDQKRNNVVLSRRAALENEVSQEQREQLLDSLQEGKEIAGVVKNITDYGAFVDLGGLDGLLHITDMSWKRVKHPSEVLKVGDALTVRVLKYDREKKRVSLGLKQMGNDPWQDIARRYPPKTRLFGRVTNLMDYGCFVQIENNIEGLVHVSEIDWTNKNVHPSKLLKLNDEVEVMVLEIDESRRRISLGIKQCLANPWLEFTKNHNKGDKISGQIRSITDFGLFVGLSGNIDGLVHLSDLSWGEAGETAIRNYKKGDEVTAVVLAMDPERERISLGIKQLENDPYSDYLETNKNNLVTGKITALESKRATVDLGNQLEGTIRVADIPPNAQIGEIVEAYVVGLDRKTNVFNLSNKQAEEGKDKDASSSKKGKKKDAAPEESMTNTTLGDLLKEHMEGRNQ